MGCSTKLFGVHFVLCGSLLQWWYEMWIYYYYRTVLHSLPSSARLIESQNALTSNSTILKLRLVGLDIFFPTSGRFWDDPHQSLYKTSLISQSGSSCFPLCLRVILNVLPTFDCTARSIHSKVLHPADLLIPSRASI